MLAESTKAVNHFTQQLLSSPPPQLIEEIASESHETRRLPDPYLFLIHQDQLLTLSGQPVADAVEAHSYLGRLEYQALETIQTWASQYDSGLTVWFSPPFTDHYPVSKIIISQIISLDNQTKVLFNRAVILDQLDNHQLLNLARSLDPDFNSSDPETLRSTPLFPTPAEFQTWFNQLSLTTSQAQAIRTNADLVAKQETYATLEEIQSTIPLTGSDRLSHQLLTVHAQQQNLIGPHSGSCPPTDSDSTSFETFSNHSLNLSEKTLSCTCPFCRQQVDAEIRHGRIRCPHCQQSAPYHC